MQRRFSWSTVHWDVCIYKHDTSLLMHFAKSYYTVYRCMFLPHAASEPASLVIGHVVVLECGPMYDGVRW